MGIFCKPRAFWAQAKRRTIPILGAPAEQAGADKDVIPKARVNAPSADASEDAAAPRVLPENGNSPKAGSAEEEGIPCPKAAPGKPALFAPALSLMRAASEILRIRGRFVAVWLILGFLGVAFARGRPHSLFSLVSGVVLLAGLIVLLRPFSKRSEALGEENKEPGADHEVSFFLRAGDDEIGGACGEEDGEGEDEGESRDEDEDEGDDECLAHSGSRGSLSLGAPAHRLLGRPDRDADADGSIRRGFADDPDQDGGALKPGERKRRRKDDEEDGNFL